jgi:hypothetical protein
MSCKMSAGVSADIVFAEFGGSLNAARTEDGGFSCGGKLTLKVGVGTALNNVALTESVTVSGKGNDAVEAVNLVGLALERTIRPWDNEYFMRETTMKGGGFLVSHTVGNDIADGLWGKGYDAAMLKNMDDDDEGRVELGIGLEANGGEEGVGIHAGAEFHSADVYKKDEEGKLDHDVENEVELAASFDLEAGGLSFEGAGSATFPNVDECVVAMSLGFGIETPTQVALVANAVKQVLSTAATFGQRLGDSKFERIVKTIAENVQMVVALEERVGTFYEVEAEYKSGSGELEVTVKSKTKWSEKEESDVATLRIAGERGADIWSQTFKV